MRFEPAPSNRTRWIKAIAVVIVGIALLIGWLSLRSFWGGATLSYELTPASVQILFGPDSVDIPRDRINDVAIVPRPTRGRRIVGTNLPGLYEGSWTFNETGPLRLYATSLASLVVIDTETGRWGISPKDPEAFVAAYERSEGGSFPPVESKNRWALVALGAVPVLALFGVLFLLVVPFGRIARGLEYELDNKGLVIHGGSRPAVFRYREISEPRLASPKGIPWQTGGASLPGLYWGSFSWKQAGPRLKLYATRLRPIILFRHRRETIGISPKDAEQFLTELNRRLARK